MSQYNFFFLKEKVAKRSKNLAGLSLGQRKVEHEIALLSLRR